MVHEKAAESVSGSETKTEFPSVLKNTNVKPMKFDIFTCAIVLTLLCLSWGLIFNTIVSWKIVDKISRIECQNERNLAVMNQLKTQYRNIESKMENIVRLSRTTLFYSELSEEYKEKVLKYEKAIILKEANKTEAIVKETCMSWWPNTTIQPQKTEQVTPISTNFTSMRNQTADKIETIKSIVKPTTPIASNPKTTNKPLLPVKLKTPHFNAASYLSGAKVENPPSSRNVNSSFFSFDQSDYVLLEREPLPNKAWCTTSDSPMLHIRLSEGIKPIAVSYQHLRWNGTIPDGAPMEYDVVTCHGKYCEDKVPLALKCKYESSGPQEQKCLVPLSSDYLSNMNSIRFYFRKTHGNSKTTCAYLIRVFAEGKRSNPHPSKETCSSLIWHRKNSPFFYNYILEKNCKVWYNNECCEDCPECCTECVAKDMNYKYILVFLVFILFIVASMIAMRRSYEADQRKQMRNRA